MNTARRRDLPSPGQRPPSGGLHFVVVLEHPHGRTVPPLELQELLLNCPARPDSRATDHSYPVIAVKLLYRLFPDARDSFLYFWRRRLLDPAGGLPIPRLLSDKPSMLDIAAGSLRDLFASHARTLLACDAATNLEKSLEDVNARLREVDILLSGKNGYSAFVELDKKRTAIVEERERLTGRLEEFREAVQSIIRWINRGKMGEDREDQPGGVQVFDFHAVIDWGRVHCSMLRECRRLEEGLPIYGCRRQILNQLHSNQVTVLVGETGSGKSTQLVQFLADSGLAGDGAILCTQPRRIAAMSIEQRVLAESRGCYPSKFIECYPTYSSTQKFNSKIIFMTDNCLLQHCMNKTSLAGVSYIIVDEAHERSLNTDLLLALIKKQLLSRVDLRLIIMSATVDACKLSDYFYGCQSFFVKGRTFPVDIAYIPDVSGEASWVSITRKFSGNLSSYVSDVVKMVAVIHQTEESGDILAFLTAQVEVEWACEVFQSSSAIVLPLHGKLSCEEQSRVFQKYPGKRKVIFCTNLAETSLTIPGVKYVVDSGMVKESRFESTSGMNVLRVCPVSQSSARQRAGRAGRTEPGKCFRLYMEADFDAMPMHQEPEIRKVHLGIAVLKILALGISNVEEFEFIDAPSTNATEMAIRNLLCLGAVFYVEGALRLTFMGLQLVKLGIEPRLGKLILECFDCNMGREGVVLAALMANSSSIFCRVGSDEDKAKADCLKVPFCHQEGDLFTLLSVYMEWEKNGLERNQWCWQNSINAKSMRRCRDTVQELEGCLRQELHMIVPSYWKWSPNDSGFDGLLKKVILLCLPENVAMYSGCERLGYEVALTGEYVQIHPSCSLLVFGNLPDWVVFGDILSTSRQYLVCVTAIDQKSLCNADPCLFDVSKLEQHRMQKTVITGISTHLLRRLCGKGNIHLRSLVSDVQMACENCRAEITVDFEKGTIQLFAPFKDMELASSLVNTALDCERKWLRDECMEKSLFHGMQNAPPPLALFGCGAEIKHLELNRRYLTVEISHSAARTVDDKQFLRMVDQFAPGIAGFSKHDLVDSDKWGRITFLNPLIAEEAVKMLNGREFCGSILKVCPVRSPERDHKLFPSHAVKANVSWPRRRTIGVAYIRCDLKDTDLLVQDCTNLLIRGRPVTCGVSRRFLDSVRLSGLDLDVTETEIYNALKYVTKRRILNVQLQRGEAVDHPSIKACEEVLLREILPFLSGRTSQNRICHVEVFSPEPKDFLMKAMITFDGSFHLEAAKALDHLHGKSLPGFQSWQIINCRQLFRSNISCPPHVYKVIHKDLDLVLESFKHCEGASCELHMNENGFYRVKIMTNATKKIADLRKPLELLMEGKVMDNANLTPAVLKLLCSKEGHDLMISVARETGTYIFYDRQRHVLKVFGSISKVSAAEEVLVPSLLTLHKKKQLEIPLRGSDLPPNLMKEVIQRFGSDLYGLKEKVPGADFVIKSTRFQVLSVQGDLEQKDKVEKIIHEVAEYLSNRSPMMELLDTSCAICLCELEEPYKLGACGHEFCRNCLLEQCESAIKSRDGFPLCCAHRECKAPFLLADLRLLLSADRLEELFRSSLGAFVTSSGGTYRFCPSPDCPSIYKVANTEESEEHLVCGACPSIYKVANTEESTEHFVCGACSAETCTKCHLEYHPFISCDMYKKFKEHPDASLMEWRKGKDHVKNCPDCGYTIEKIDGCNHIACKCGKHICWVCLDSSDSSDECYSHLRSVHQAIM